jgi:hypothetical protein
MLGCRVGRTRAYLPLNLRDRCYVSRSDIPEMEGPGVTEPAGPDGRQADCPFWCDGRHDSVDGDHLGTEYIGGVSTGAYVNAAVIQRASPGSLVVERYVSVEASTDWGRYHVRLSVGEAWQLAAIFEVLGHEPLAMFIREAAQQITDGPERELGASPDRHPGGTAA